MTTDLAAPPALERPLARVLYAGTWLASVVIAIGIALALVDSRAGTRGATIAPDMRVVTAGIVLFILLPVVRVALMLIAFLRQRDFGLSAIAALVLLFIALGFVVGRA
jgi:uncharacterized membrane protein